MPKCIDVPRLWRRGTAAFEFTVLAEPVEPPRGHRRILRYLTNVFHCDLPFRETLPLHRAMGFRLSNLIVNRSYVRGSIGMDRYRSYPLHLSFRMFTHTVSHN